MGSMTLQRTPQPHFYHRISKDTNAASDSQRDKKLIRQRSARPTSALLRLSTKGTVTLECLSMVVSGLNALHEKFETSLSKLFTEK